MPKMVKIGLMAWAGPIPRFSRDRSGLPFVFFVLLSRRPGEIAGPILTLNGLKCAVSAKEVPFGGLDDEK